MPMPAPTSPPTRSPQTSTSTPSTADPVSPEADASRAPEIRIDQLTGLRTIIAPGRASRPQALDMQAPRPAATADDAGECPLCEGHEDMTPPEVWANRAGGEADAPGW